MKKSAVAIAVAMVLLAGAASAGERARTSTAAITVISADAGAGRADRPQHTPRDSSGGYCDESGGGLTCARVVCIEDDFYQMSYCRYITYSTSEEGFAY